MAIGARSASRSHAGFARQRPTSSASRFCRPAIVSAATRGPKALNPAAATAYGGGGAWRIQAKSEGCGEQPGKGARACEEGNEAGGHRLSFVESHRAIGPRTVRRV